MSSLGLDIDAQMTGLELEWRHAFEASILARAEYESLLENPKVKPTSLLKAIKQLDRAESVKARIMVKIERLEETLIDYR